MKTEITIEAVEQEKGGYCDGCIFNNISLTGDCDISIDAMAKAGLPECGEGYIYKIKQGVETKD